MAEENIETDVPDCCESEETGSSEDAVVEILVFSAVIFVVGHLLGGITVHFSKN